MIQRFNPTVLRGERGSSHASHDVKSQKFGKVFSFSIFILVLVLPGIFDFAPSLLITHNMLAGSLACSRTEEPTVKFKICTL